jgi:predicted Zn-dependent protease
MPERARPSVAASDEEAFRKAASARYRQLLAALSARGHLDDDAILLGRVRRIASGLISAATALRPEVESWPWEIHVTSDVSMGTFCMAGGKILVEGESVRQMRLDDGELAMLLGHEMAHALAGHRRAAPAADFNMDAAGELREVQIAVGQENEADEIGMDLAWRAGWPASSLVSFFDKLAVEEGAGAFNSTHASAASRASRAREIAAAFVR